MSALPLEVPAAPGGEGKRQTSPELEAAIRRAYEINAYIRVVEAVFRSEGREGEALPPLTVSESDLRRAEAIGSSFKAYRPKQGGSR